MVKSGKIPKVLFCPYMGLLWHVKICPYQNPSKLQESVDNHGTSLGPVFLFPLWSKEQHDAVVFLLVAGPGPGDVVPAPDNVHDWGYPGGDADGKAEGQQVIVATESEGQNVSNTIQTPGD